MLFDPHLIAGFDIQTLPQQVANGFLAGSIYALIALGYTMVYGVLKLINFAHGEVFMLGAYGSLFASWALGYGPNGKATHSNFAVLLIMMLVSMTVCGLVGVLIERFAYRPLRNQARIASLITAIGLSLLLQYGGQVFLLNGVPQSISDRVNPFLGKNIDLTLRGPDKSLLLKAEELQPKVKETTAAFQADLSSEKSAFDLSPKGEQLQKAMQQATRDYEDAVNTANAHKIAISIPEGKLMMLCTTIVLMAILTYLVLFTKRGRAMRAVSLDFNASALMGINVDSIITFTFILGSTLAGAGAMLYATLQSGTKIDPFLGMAPGLKAFVAAVLGGIGNIPGAVLGGMLMGIAENLVDWAGYDSYRDAIAFVILIVVLLFRPGGLLGSAKVEKV
jgi:branched-chain amino acid transport system permease protein